MSKGSDSIDGSSLLPSSKAVEILHVDDDPGLADLTATVLEREREPFTVRTETDPAAALQTLRSGDTAYDCVVSDYDMPGQNGLDLLERVRETHPDLPFILFTGKGSEEIASDAITAGVTDYLQKGGGTDQYRVLANRINNAVERYWAERYMNRGLEAIETARDGIAILSGDGRIEYANSACASALGYDRGELLGLHWERFYQEDAVAEVYDVLLPEARDGRWQGRTTFVRKDGERIDVEHSLSYTADGSLICTFSNPTTVESPASTRSAKERALEAAPLGVVLTDPHAEDNPIVYANDRFTELTGYDSSEVIGRNCRFLQGERTDEETVAAVRSAIDDAEPITVEIRNYRADGTEFWNRLRIEPVFDEAGDIDRFVGFQEDITRRKTSEERLHSDTARLEALFENSPEMIFVHDADGVVRDVNRRVCDELGYEEDELRGMQVWDIDPTVDPEHARSYWAELPSNEPQLFEGTAERKDGSTFPIEVHLIRLDLDGEDRFVAMDRDITTQKDREAELVERNERLDRFASVVSHDLRGPLQVATGRLALLAEEVDNDHIPPIETALARMDDLIDDLLALAQGGVDAMEPESVDLDALARQCWETTATSAATLRAESELTVTADRDRLQQLLENLFRNAVDHGGRDVTVTLGETDSGFYVADDGSGLPEADRETVFEAGFTTSDDGTGFGLSIVAEVAEAHGWEVSATTGSDGGARFDVTTATDR